MIEFKNVSKRFGDCIANRDVTFKIEKGTIHGLIGENGAGKSTAMKTLFGFYPPDQGEIWIQGKKVQIRNPVEAMRLGIGMVHQHFMLAGPQTVLENVILGHEPTRLSTILDRARARQDLIALSEKYGLQIQAWDQPIAELSVGQQQRVEILKLLYQQSEVLILDEPTAVLTPQEVRDLFQNLKKLKAEGKTILLISHKLKEVLEFTDSVTVMRRGETVGSMPTSQATEDTLAELMVGRKVSFTYQGERKVVSDAVKRRPLLRIKNLESSVLKEVSFDLLPGEILGIGGVQGNGQSELLRFLSDPIHETVAESSIYEVRSKDVRNATPQNLRKMGIGLAPEDRHREGLFLDQDMVENFLLGQETDPRYSSTPNFLKFGHRIHRKKVADRVRQKIQEFDIRPTNPSVRVGGMSGGNQQKLLIARALDPNPDILFIAHPTRGVDVGAIELIHEIIMKARNAGKAIILFSSELDELIDLSDRLLIFFEGRIQAEFDRQEFEPWTLGKVMGGGTKTTEKGL